MDPLRPLKHVKEGGYGREGQRYLTRTGTYLICLNFFFQHMLQHVFTLLPFNGDSRLSTGSQSHKTQAVHSITSSAIPASTQHSNAKVTFASQSQQTPFKYPNYPPNRTKGQVKKKKQAQTGIFSSHTKIHRRNKAAGVLCCAVSGNRRQKISPWEIKSRGKAP